MNKLVPSTPAEIEIFQQREHISNNRKEMKRLSSHADAPVGRSHPDLIPLVERGSALLDMPALAHPNSVMMSSTGTK